MAMWGNRWKGKTVQARCDNAAVVDIVNSGSSKDSDAMHLQRCLAFIVAKHDVNLVAKHISGVDNSLADAIYPEIMLLCFFQIGHRLSNPPLQSQRNLSTSL